VPVQAAVLETALALAGAVLAGQTAHPDVQESARALTGILHHALAQAAVPVQVRVPAQQPTASTVTGTGTSNATQRLAGVAPADAANVRRAGA
jgi:hypothetical protein